MRALWLGALAVFSCAPPAQQHAYSDDTGLTGVSVAEGSLAGSFALVIEFATVINVAVVGDRNGGSQGLRLVTTTWDAASKTYNASFTWCANDIIEIEGTKTVVSEDTLHTLEHVPFTVSVDHGAGAFLSNTVLDLWGVHNLPDPMETPLPTKDDYQQSPQSDWIWDEDGDGNAGVTAHLNGNLSAEVHECSRSAYVLDGTVLSVDHVEGLTRSKKSEQHVVSSDNRLAVGESRVRPDPDPKLSWFDLVRLADNATCDDVKAAQQSGKLASKRPF